MKLTASSQKYSENINKESWRDSIARAGIFKFLNAIKVGHLCLEENGRVYSFGEKKSEAKVIANIQVHSASAYTSVLSNGTIGSGEAYMEGAWSSPDLVAVIRLMVMNMQRIKRFSNPFSRVGLFIDSLVHLLKRNSKSGSKKNISAHYDLGNEFFSLFLDSSMMYSSAVYPSTKATLEEAAEYKLALVCDKLNLNESDHLLEIGTGWGGLAVYAAKTRGCRVTSVTISKEQYELARQRVIENNLEDKVEIQLKDYRDIDGQFDKIVSIEMVEAVGYEYYSTFFKKCSHLLKENGKMFMQAITIADQRFEKEKNTSDFIRKYIFPGGCLPSIEVIAKHISRDTDMQIINTQDITLHYADTLKDWRERFFQQLNAVKSQGFDDRFIRMWDFYLCYCEGGFRERVIGTSQFLFAKPRCFDLPAVKVS